MMEPARDQGAGLAHLIGGAFLAEDPDGVHGLGVWNFRDEADVVSDGAIRHGGFSNWGNRLLARSHRQPEGAGTGCPCPAARKSSNAPEDVRRTSIAASWLFGAA